MKKAILAVLLFCALIATQCKKKESTMQGEDNDFRISNSKSISKIFLADRQGQTATLERNADDTWTVNKLYKARPAAIELLLKTLREVRVRYSVDAAAKPQVDKMLATQSIKVEVYEGSSTPSKTFYVGTGTADQLGTYMYMDGAEKAYVTHIANWEGVLAPRFMTNLEDWRDRTLFAAPLEKIKEASVEYSGSQSIYSFTCKVNGSNYELKPFLASTPTIQKTLVTGQVKSFLTAFENVSAEGWETYNEKKDSVLHTSPFCTVSLTTTDNKTRSISFYPIAGRLTDDNGAGLVGHAPIERYYLWVDKTDFMLGQHNVFKRIFWAYPAFFEAPKPQSEGKAVPRKY